LPHQRSQRILGMLLEEQGGGVQGGRDIGLVVQGSSTRMQIGKAQVCLSDHRAV
jgi:hypothetical protein